MRKAQNTDDHTRLVQLCEKMRAAYLEKCRKFGAEEDFDLLHRRLPPLHTGQLVVFVEKLDEAISQLVPTRMYRVDRRTMEPEELAVFERLSQKYD